MKLKEENAVLKISEIKLPSVNHKHLIGLHKKMFLNPKYRLVKKVLVEEMLTIEIDPPYIVNIHLSTYLDIDNPIKVILDALQEKKIIVDDKFIEVLNIKKTPIKKGASGKLLVWVEKL